MKIRSDDQALTVVRSIRDALNQLVVQGLDNCYIIVASSKDLDALAEYLSDKAEKEEYDRKEQETQ